MGSVVTIVSRTGCRSSPSTLTLMTVNQLPGSVILLGTLTCQVAAGVVGVGVEVAVGDGVGVKVAVAVSMGGSVGVTFKVEVGVGDEVAVKVGVAVSVAVEEGVGVGDKVAVAVGVETAAGSKITSVIVLDKRSNSKRAFKLGTVIR